MRMVFEGKIESMVLYQSNYWSFSGLFATSNQFWARARFGSNLVGPFTTLERLEQESVSQRHMLEKKK